MNIEFDRVDVKTCDVLVDGADYGQLEFDDEQNAWVLWPESIDDGVTYFGDLEETKEAITDEIKGFSEIKNFLEDN